MKKIVKIFFISFVLFSLSAFTAFADMGSKPRVQITLKNSPQEAYYLDLLYDAGDSPLHNSAEREEYNEKMFNLLKNYNDNGWIPVLAKGTSIPIWGRLTPDENGMHIFSYFGVPDEFKIIIVTESGEIKVSDAIKRKTMEISLTLDYNDMSYTSKPVWTAYIAQFASTCSITVIVEFIVLMMFFMAKKTNLEPFLKMNFITQVFMTVVLSTNFIMAGTIGTYMWFPVVELIIFIFEMWYCKKYFTGENDMIKLAYAFTANAASALLTFFSLETIMDIMFNVIR